MRALDGGYGLLVVDTLGKLARLENENDNSEWMRAMEPLQNAAHRGLALAVVRHEKKGGGEVGESGRGGSQVDADIAAALCDGTLAGASLDVFQTEPLPAESPLWSAPNLVITPHVAAVSSPRALSVQIAEQITAFEQGKPLANLVDLDRGY